MFSRTTNLIMQFFSVAESIDGRIKLQKVIYILQQKGAIDFDLVYKYALYGPYSQDLQIEIDYLTSIGFIKEKAGSNYAYRINKKFPIPVKIDSNIKKFKSLITKLLTQESQLLEVTSTIYYLESHNYQGRDSIEQKIKLLKPNLQDRINEAFNLYASLEAFSIS